MKWHGNLRWAGDRSGQDAIMLTRWSWPRARHWLVSNEQYNNTEHWLYCLYLSSHSQHASSPQPASPVEWSYRGTEGLGSYSVLKANDQIEMRVFMVLGDFSLSDGEYIDNFPVFRTGGSVPGSQHQPAPRLPVWRLRGGGAEPPVEVCCASFYPHIRHHSHGYNVLDTSLRPWRTLTSLKTGTTLTREVEEPCKL